MQHFIVILIIVIAFVLYLLNGKGVTWKHRFITKVKVKQQNESNKLIRRSDKREIKFTVNRNESDKKSEG